MPLTNEPNPFDLLRKSCAIGFFLAAIFVALIYGFNIAGIGQLIAGSDIAVMATLAFWALNGIVFSSVQFGIFVMGMADDDDEDGPGGGHRQLIPIPVERDR